MLPLDSIYVPANIDEILKRLLEDIELAARLDGIENVPIQPGTDLYIRERANAGMFLLCFASVALRDASRRVLDADIEDLHEMREELGLPIVPPSRASGSVEIGVSGGGSVTIPDGTTLIWPNGIRGEVDGTQVGMEDGDVIPVVAIDAGEAGNLAAGGIVRWAAGNILNLQTEAEVTTEEPITGGTDEETAARLRSRIINAMRNRPQGGNWAQIVEWSMNATAAVQYAVVYPALAGPGSFKVVICKAPILDSDDFTRTLSSTVRNEVDAYLRARVPDHVEFTVQTPTEVTAHFTANIELPPSAGLGGDGNGWTDDVPWPIPESGGRVQVAAVTSVTQITIGVTPEPEVGTKILWWAPIERRFIEALVTTVGGSAGAWLITLNTPLTDALDTDVAVGDYISPGCTHYDDYSTRVRELLQHHGPGENTADVDRLPRALRRPRPNESFILPEGGSELIPIPTKIGASELDSLIEGRPEILDAEWAYRSVTEPAVPALVSGAPEVLVPGKFGVYPL